MFPKRIRTVPLFFAGALAAVIGCNGITPDTTLTDALGQLAQNAQQVDALNQITVGDLVTAFQQFVDQLPQAGPGGPMGGLTPEELQQLENLQSQLDQGQITEDEFATQVQAIVGDHLPMHAFAGFGFLGGPFPHGPRFDRADALNLTDEQKQQAQDIFQRLHDDVQQLRQDAHDQILAVLTPDQRARLNELSFVEPDGLGMPGRGMGMGAGMGMRGWRHAGRRAFLQDLADELQLTDEQKAQIEQIRADLRAAVKARQQQARDEFRAILTPEQLAVLDRLEGEPAAGQP